MSASANRKNGKQASCEPCRRGKVRCDHHMPICDRCRRRNMDAECYYHPAPLTRLSKRVRMSSSEYHETGTLQASSQNSPVAEISLPHHNLDAHVSNNNSSIPIQSVRGPDTTPSGAIPLLSLQGLDDTITRPIVPAAVYHDDRGNKTLEGDLVSIVHILSHVQYCATIKKLVSEYYDLGQAAIIPRCLVLPAISDLERIQEEVLHLSAATDDTASRAAFLPVAERVWRATKSKIDIISTTSLEDFRSHYTGANLRVETIGLISAIAARAARVGLFPNNEDRHNFLQAMFQCSARCVHLARELATEMNDVIVWLSYENLRVTTSMQGYAGM